MPGTFKGRTTRSESSSMRILFPSELHNPRTNDKNGLYVEIPWGNYEPHVTEEEAIKGIRLNLESPLNVSCIPEYQSCILSPPKGTVEMDRLVKCFRTSMRTRVLAYRTHVRIKRRGGRKEGRRSKNGGKRKK